MRLINTGRARHVFLLLAFSVALTGEAWRSLGGWWLFGALSVLGSAVSIMLLVHNRDRWNFGSIPLTLLAFLGLATLSLLWSFYPGATALGLLSTWLLAIGGAAIAISFHWKELRVALSQFLRFVLAASLLFEFVVSAFVRHPVLPLFSHPGVDYSQYEKIPKMLYWSRNEFFEVFDGGRIQGIVGNSNQLGFLALLALIVFAIDFADRQRHNRWAVLPWLGIACAVVLFTRSATVAVALVGTAAVIGIALVPLRVTASRTRRLIYLGLGLGAVLIGTVGVVFRVSIPALLGKSSDFTGRIEIWQSLGELAQQRPAFGWGWVSYWVPWAPPFDTLSFRNGVRMLQAHNVWVDVWFQLGVIGLLLFAALVLGSFARSWLFAIDSVQLIPNLPGPPARWEATRLLPLAIITALLVQSIAESRLINEFGMLFLVLIAVKTANSDTRDTVP